MNRLCVVGVVLAAGWAWGQGPASEKQVLEIIEPTQGRPIMVRPEENFYFMFWTRESELGKIDVSLRHSLSWQEGVPLTAPVRPYRMQKAYWVMLLKVPALARPGVYDLFIDLGRHYQRVPRAVRIVGQYQERFRFVHLSNMNVGEPTAPDFDDRLVAEINLLNPQFILATGDFIERGAEKDAGAKWRRIKGFFGRFRSPCYVLCGDQEDPSVFQKQVDHRPVGFFDYGPYHFVLMLDTQRFPIDQHRANIEAVLENLKQARTARASILVGRSETLRILDGLRAQGQDVGEVLRGQKVKMIICGGSTDWDFSEHAAKVSALTSAGVAYVRTGQSSTSLKNGGTGESHYRVFEVGSEGISYVYPDGGSGRAVQHSVPAGRIRMFHDGPNDGSRSTERISILNTLNQSFGDCQVLFRLKGDDPKSVTVFNGKVQEVLRGDGHLVVLVAVSLPDKSAVQVAASTDASQAQTYRKLPVEFSVSGPKALTFSARKSTNGLTYLESPQALTLTVKNASGKELTVQLQARLAGQALVLGEAATTQDGGAGGVATKTVRLAGGGATTLAIRPIVRTVSAGEHHVGVYCLNDPLQRVWVHKVNVENAKVTMQNAK